MSKSSLGARMHVPRRILDDYRYKKRMLKLLIKVKKMQNDFEGNNKLSYKPAWINMKGGRSTVLVGMINNKGKMLRDADGILYAFRNSCEELLESEARGLYQFFILCNCTLCLQMKKVSST